MSARVSLLFAALGLAACGSSDDASLGPRARYRIPGCEAYDTLPCDVRTSACQERLMQIAVCLRQDEPAELPPVTVLNEATFAALLRQEATEREPSPHLQEDETAFHLFGLVETGAFADEAMVEFNATHISGVYRPDTQDIIIVDHAEKTDAEEASNTLVHELVHALQHRELADWGDDFVVTFDSHLALKSLIEGEARFHELRYRAPMLGVDPRKVDWARTMQNAVEGEERWVLDQDSPLLAVSVALPYGWGARLFSFDWDATGHAGVAARFADPPTTTHALMASVDAYAPDDFTPLDIALPELPAGWSSLSHDVLGSVGTFLILARNTTPDEARKLALDWRGDSFTVLQGTLDAAGTVVNAALWSAEFASPASAEAAASHVTLTGPGTTRVTGTRLSVAVSDRATDLGWALPPE